METRPIPIEGLSDKYAITEDGQLYSNIKGRYLKGGINTRGYKHYFLNNKWYFAHRLVYMTFVGPIKYEINHKDMDKLNNHWKNLEDITHAENIRKARSLKNWPSGRLPGFKASDKIKQAISAATSRPVYVYENGKLIHGLKSLKEATYYLQTYYSKVQRVLKSGKPTRFRMGVYQLRYDMDPSLKCPEPQHGGVCPLTSIPNVDYSKHTGPLKHVAKHIHINKEGYRVRFWEKGYGMREKWFKSRKAILQFYKLPDNFPLSDK